MDAFDILRFVDILREGQHRGGVSMYALVILQEHLDIIESSWEGDQKQSTAYVRYACKF